MPTSSSSNINTAKETTPVVSANCDAEEVTLPTKLHKDRESPSKGRKLKDHMQQKVSVSSSTAVSSSSSEQSTSDRPSSTNNDDKSQGDTARKHKDVSSSSTTNSPQVVVNKDVIPEEIVEPKKGQRKDNKAEQKVSVSDVEPHVQQQTPVVVQQEVLGNGKSDFFKSFCF